jgi:hypothetical protein
MRRVVLALTLVGCGTPYQPMGVRGGYEDHPIGKGIIAIHVRGNGYTSAGTVLEYAYRRAGEVCSNGFDPIDGQASTSSSWQRNGNTVNEVDKHEMTVLVHCREPVAEEPPHDEMPERHQQPIPVSTEPDPDAPAPGRVIRSGGQPVYCTSSSTDPNAGLCFLQPGDCDAEHAREGEASTDCKQHANTACFNARRVLDEVNVTVCAVSIKDCERRLASYRADVDFAVDQAQCEIYRSNGGGQ